VVGLGAFGLEVARELRASGRDVVVVERDERNRFLSEATALGFPVVFGHATSAATLESARGLTSDDMVNIETGIAVRDLLEDRRVHGALPVVMRVFDQALSRTISAGFGFDNIQSIEEITAPWFVSVALGLEVLGAFTVAGQSFTVGRLAVAAHGALAALAMRGCRRVLASSPWTGGDRCSGAPTQTGNPFRAGGPGVHRRAERRADRGAAPSERGSGARRRPLGCRGHCGA
jgi:voltage-gated potassium channel Kch